MKFIKNDTTMSAVGFITGLAVGTAIGILLASTRGKEVRNLLAGKFISESYESNISEISDNADPKMTGNSKEVADHLAHLGHEAELGR